MRNIAQLRPEQHKQAAIVETDVAGLVKDAVHRAVETAARRLPAGGEGCHVHGRISPRASVGRAAAGVSRPHSAKYPDRLAGI
jgi:hypothetical protein